jgi:glutamate-1-semialdehyde aminotransferase
MRSIQEVMEATQSTFISSTFWTERIGPTAALKTLEVMEREKSWEQITKKGLIIQDQWDSLAKSHNLNLVVNDLPAISSFSFESDRNLEYKTLITQEMLKKNILASNLLFVSTKHSEEIIDNYISELDKVFDMINKCENGTNINDLLEGPTCHGGFKRLN